ncbi:M4 family metallopeptidase [Cytophaga aurantiaca]|uniref:M4 family metallopeptidase n=1 Tax=Cytophaga aurantiaca TaxID=29530 RepID=UPI000379C02A|nr:M4 family metallopeptidase [Cytophaga aurantiaca]
MRYLCIAFFATLQFSISVTAQTSFDEKERPANPGAKPTFSSRVIKGDVNKESSILQSGTSLMSTPLAKTAASPQSIQQKQSSYTIRSSSTGLPIFICKKSAASVQLRASNGSLIQQTVLNYLTELSSILELTDAAQQFTIFKIETDPLGGQIIRLQQNYNGIPIDGCESIVHINAFGQATSWNGSYIKPSLVSKTTFTTASTVAVQNALTDLQKEHHIIEMSAEEKAFLDYSSPKVKTVFYIDQKLTTTCIPAYIIEVRPNFVDWWEYVIDANTGNVISAHSKTCHADGAKTSTGNDLNGVSQTINTYQKALLYYTVDASRAMYKSGQSSMPDNPVGAIQTLDMNNTWGNSASFRSISSPSNTFSAKAISAHNIAGKSYEYYLQVHGRNSIDGKGGTVISFINVADPDDGTAMDNAFWNGKAMYYGNGNDHFKPLAGGLDVGGHELTHGVVQNSANLSYQGESGAINESMADIFGCSIDPDDWQIGEDVVLLSKYPSGALRDLSDPHNGGTDIDSPGWQPKFVSEKYTGSLDNGGVHINSGIPNYAYYLLATATSRSEAEKIFYRALTVYLTRSSQFIDLRIACISAATDLYNASSSEVTAVQNAFDQVGITTTSGTPTVIVTDDYPVNPGTEYLLAYNLNTSSTKKLYRINTSANTQITINTTSATSKPSVTDDGNTAYFINSSHQIKGLFLTPNSTQERIIESQQIWNSLAISNDGNRMAATTIDNDTAIYVYDFNTNRWSTFILYSPTFSSGIKSGGPIYADAMEWDHTGQYLVYDCYNEFENTSGDNISFWDINFIDVWDNSTNDFADGTITKLFPSLEEGISVGNPTFAKNSSHIIAFDYIDEIAGASYVKGCNTERNEVNTITQTNVLGYPSYNRLDNKVAYVFNTGTTDVNKSIWLVDLAVDKISALSSGDDVGYVAKSKWPIFYANGLRTIPTSTKAPQQNAQVLNVYPNPGNGQNVHLQLKSDAAVTAEIKITSTTGQIIYTTKADLNAGENDVPLSIPVNVSSGYYIILVESGNSRWLSRFIKI